MEAMRAWVKQCWNSIGIEVTLTQALPKGYYLFMFKEPSMAMKVISSGQWMFRHLPFCFMRWTKEFNPDGHQYSECGLSSPTSQYTWHHGLKPFSHLWDRFLAIDQSLIIILHGTLKCS